MTPGSVALELASKVYGATCALRRASARFSPGRVTVIEGPNGSGKSTLLALLATLIRPTSGTVDLTALGRSRPEVRAAIGWLGVESLCYLDLTGRENLRLFAQLYGRPPGAVIEESCARFDLRAFLDRPVRVCSRGQKQRLALARALLHSPRLLLLDEPTMGLDAATTARLVVAVEQEASRGTIVVVVTHDPVFANLIAQDRLYMQRGRLLTARDTGDA